MNISLSKKLFLFICMVFTLTIIPLFYIAETSLSQFGSYAYRVNKEQIEKMSSYYLADIASKIAQKHNEIFKRVKIVASIMGSNIENIYNNIEVLSKEPLGEMDTLYKNPKNLMFVSPISEPVFTGYWAGKSIPHAVQKEINALSHYKPTLIKSKELLKECLATHVITKTGIGYYCTSDINAKKAAYNLPPLSKFDLRDGEPFTTFTKKNRHTRETQWTDIYKDDIIDGFMMTATTPVYSTDGEFKGVTGIDMPIDNIIFSLTDNSFLLDITNQENSFAFLQNEQGYIIAFPKRFHALFGLNVEHSNFSNSADTYEFSLQYSSIESIRNIYNKILNMNAGAMELIIKEEAYLLAVGILDEIGWRIILVAKKTDILASVEKTASALKKSQKLVWKDFLFHSLLILALSVGLILYAIKIFIAPIKQFIETTKKIAKGDFSKNLNIGGRTDEIGTLSKALNSMTAQLKASENLKKGYTNKLEDDVALRTKELEGTNNELNAIKDDLEKLVDQKTIQLKKINEHLLTAGENERKSLASDLHDSVAQTLAFSIGKLKNMEESDALINKGMISEVKDLLMQSIGEIRLLIYQLRPPILDDFEIDVALGYLIEGYQNNRLIKIVYVNNSDENLRVSPDIRLHLYRTSNELIVNILKHSKAKNASLQLSNSAVEVSIKIEDDGIGFDLDKIQKIKYTAVGLISVSERIRNLGGKFEVVSIPDNGTKIRISVPCIHKQTP